MENPAYFELNFKPNVQLVSVVRRFVSEFYQRFLGDADGTSRVALATHELLENAVKYSKDGETTISIQVGTDRPRTVKIEMRNRAEAPHLAAIREILDGVGKAPDAFAFYQRILAAKAKTREPSGGLGLARICAEGEMKVSYVLNGDEVTIEATTAVAEAQS